MTLIQGYLFRQLLLPVAGACGALVGIGVLSQSLDQLEFVVERGQSLWLMLKLTLLAVPQLLGVILPIGLFVGALVALSRLQREQELTAIQAAGLTRMAMIRPAVRLALIVTALGLLINAVIQPWSQSTARTEAFAVRSDLAALLIQEGQFVQGPDGLTVYVQEIEQNGLLKNLFIYIQKGETTETWNATEARFGRVNGEPMLTLIGGSSQRYSSAGVLNLLSFDTYVFPLGAFAEVADQPRFKPADLGLSDLFMPRPEMIPSVGTRNELLAEGHSRLASPLYALTAMALALAAILAGSFSRTGYGMRVAKAAAAFLLVRILGYGLVAAAAWTPWLNILQYVFPLGVAAVAVALLFRRPARRRSTPWIDVRALLPRGVGA
ncbi:MAG: LptF/LptG family permease [Brevundimonas sp.]|uniref:LptF/LptG family permease n=1 Tax=Brevundimonas sp. TaxID=1871086 RepID=UPI0027348C15|nr:LptF/LptG family permease [Brevundimonas sp.]MDP3377786.1 LptF/LptG family permease [Brevundimonas sp.]